MKAYPKNNGVVIVPESLNFLKNIDLCLDPLRNRLKDCKLGWVAPLIQTQFRAFAESYLS
jgi:hypothetical protein